MPFEIFNAGPARPERIEALLGVLLELNQPCPIADLKRLLMPGVPDGEREIVQENLNASLRLGLVIEVEPDRWVPTDACPQELGVELRRTLQRRILSAKASGDDHFRFCQYMGWQIACLGRSGRPDITSLSSPQAAEQFTRDVRGDDPDLAVGPTKASNAMNWVVYLGLGYRLDTVGQFAGHFFPCPADLLADNLDLLMEGRAGIEARRFFDNLSEAFPLLDGGSVARTLPADLGSSLSISSGLSIAVRLLHDQRVVELVPAGDSPESVQLWPDQTHAIAGSIHSLRRPKAQATQQGAKS